MHEQKIHSNRARSSIHFYLFIFQEKDKPNSTTMNGSPGSISGMGVEQMGVKMEPAETECLSISGSSSAGTTLVSHNGVKPVSPEQDELIQRLVYYQREYEQPSDEDIKKITVSMSDRSERKQKDPFFFLTRMRSIGLSFEFLI